MVVLLEIGGLMFYKDIKEKSLKLIGFFYLFLAVVQWSEVAFANLCQGRSWVFEKEAARQDPKHKKIRTFYLSSDSIIWCNRDNKLAGRIAFFKISNVAIEDQTVLIALNQKDRKRKSGEHIRLLSQDIASTSTQKFYS